MNLSDQQKQTLTAWVHAGLSLHEIQQAIAQQWQHPLTYLQTRFLLDDHGLELQPKSERENTSPQQASAAPEEAQEGHFHPVDEAASNSLGQVQVSVSPVQRPGSMMNGTVTFSDGQRAQWQLDEMGRLGLIPERTGYRPTQEDIAAFQMQLQSAMQ